MKKAVFIAVAGIVLLIVSNVYYYRDTYFWQIETQKQVLKKELLLCSDEINQFFKETQNNVSLLMSKQDLELFFCNPGRDTEAQKRFELLYNRYAGFLIEMRVYNSNGQVFVVRKGANHTFVTSLDKGTFEDVFVPRTQILTQKGQIEFVQPLVDETTVYGMVELVIDMNAFFKSIFHSFNLDQYQFQWLVTEQGNVVYGTMPIGLLPGNDADEVLSMIKHGRPFELTHRLKAGETDQRVLTVFRPLDLKGEVFFLAFSLPTDLITNAIARNSIIVALISLIVVIGVVVLFGSFLHKRANAEKMAKLNQEAFRKMIYYLPAGILFIDNTNKVVNVNRAFLKIFDFDDEDLLVGHPFEDGLVFSNVQLVSKEKYSDYSFKFSIRNSDNVEMLIVNEKIPFYLGQKRYLVDVYTEIPVMKDVTPSAEKQRQAQTAFIANISHELRTPLNGIVGMTDLLSQSVMPAVESDMLGILKRSADTLLSLINDILDFSKIESGKFDIESIPFDIKAELENTLQGFKVLSQEKGIQLTWQIPVVLPPDFIGDPMRFRQVLNNLLSNAIKFTDRGRVHVLVTNTQLLNGNAGLLFSVKDTGIGIDKEKQRFIFNSFYQADESSTRRYGGTGLGTTISKELVQLMGGEIWVSSPCDLSTDMDYPGSEFCFTLPLRSRKLVKTVNTGDVRDFTQIRAVVVTDDVLQVQTVSRNLTALRVDYRIVSPTQETIDLLRTSSRYHLLVIDNRPDFNGIDFMQELFNHQLHKNFIILFQSSDNQKSNTNFAKRLGADAYLRKPVRLMVLREFILANFPNIEERNVDRQMDANQEEIKILVAEDNKLNQRVAQNLFKKIGYNIDLANNGAEALEKLKQIHYDLVFMDIFMPSMDGIEAVKAIKTWGFGCPVIAMTASNDPFEKQKALEAGMDDYICKPARTDDILRMITKWSKRKW